MSNFLRAVLLLLVCFGCQFKESGEVKDGLNKRKRPSALENGKIFGDGDRKLLYGGEVPGWHFDITNSILIDSQYHYGIGREQFDALINPEFITEAEADSIYKDEDRFLIFNLKDESRAYSIELLTHHEVVNDVIGGEPVAAAYCVLADLGAMYSRVIGGETLTFALSGYTYYDPEVWNGLDGFVWWDRETESTWWPLIGKAVSGDLIELPLKVYDEKYWDQTNWGDIKGKYDNLMVLKPGQQMDPPLSWTPFEKSTIAAMKSSEKALAVSPPKWGENGN